MRKSAARDRSVLLVDDEPEHLAYLTDYLEVHGVRCRVARNLREGLAETSDTSYDLVLVDMTIPDAADIPGQIRTRMKLATEYPGLAVIMHARSRGYRQGQIIAYSVHDDDGIEQELSKLDVRYILKGRPTEIKKALKSALSI